LCCSEMLVFDLVAGVDWETFPGVLSTETRKARAQFMLFHQSTVGQRAGR
jgi:hypothetical protein